MGVISNRALLAIGIAVLLFGTIVGIASQIRPTYHAEASVVVQPSRTNLTQVDQTQSGQTSADTNAVDTEVEMIKSRAIAETVVDQLELASDPEFNPPTSKWNVDFSTQFPFVIFSSTKSITPVTDQIRAKVIDEVQRRTLARRIGLTYVVHVAFSSTSPAKAEKITNAIVDAYLARQVTQKINLVAQANEELESSVDKLRQDALASAATAEQYKSAHSVLSAEGATMVEGQISKLDQEIADAKADRIDKVAKLNASMAGRNSGENIDAALNSDTINELRKQEAQLSTQYAQLAVQFKPDYPEVKRAQAQLTDIRREIQSQISRIHSSLVAGAQGASQREASLLASRTQAQSQLTANNDARVALVALELHADAAKKTYESYLNRASDVAAARSLQQADASVNYKAAAAMNSPSPNMLLVMAGAALLAMIAGAAVILLPEFLNRRVRSGMDIEHEIGMPLAAALPDITSIGHTRRLRGPTAPANYLTTEPLTAFAESFRNLRAFLTLSDRADPSKVTAITSAMPREGKTMTALCLAHTLAQTGASVVLVDCDLRQRGVTKLTGEADVGIVEVIENRVPLSKALIRDAKTGLWVLPVGRDERIPHDLFGKREADELLRALADRFDHVILDTPPILGVADARFLAAKADKVLFVIHWNKTPTSAVQAATDILHEVGARAVGAILSKVNVRQQARYGYGDSTDYFHAYKRYYAGNA
jgi:capsular exopolysaccharide synthesis family protein